MADYILPYHSSTNPTPRQLREIRYPLGAFLSTFFKQPVSVREDRSNQWFEIRNYEGPIGRLADAIKRKTSKPHANPVVVLVNKLREKEECEPPLPPETPEEILEELNYLSECFAVHQTQIEQLGKEKSELTTIYDQQQRKVEADYEAQIEAQETSFATEKSNLEKLLSETKKENALLEERNKSLMSSLDGAYNPRSGPNSVICSSLSQQSATVKKLDTILRSANITIPEILRIGSMQMHDYINRELGTTLTLEEIENLTETAETFERTPQYAEIYEKYVAALKDKTLLAAFSSLDLVPDGIKDYYQKLNKEQIEKTIKDFENAKESYDNSVKLFNQISEHTQKWRRCNHTFSSINATQWSIPIFITNSRDDGNYKLEIAVPSGEPDGALNGMLEDVIRKSARRLELQVTEDKGLKKYVASVPAEQIDDITTAQYGIVKSLDEIFSKSDLAKIAKLEITELNRLFSTKTAEAPAAGQTA